MHIISVNCLIEKIPIVGWEFWSEQWIWNPVSPVGATGEWPGDTLDSDKWLFPPPFILFTIQRLSLNKTLFLLSMLLAVVSKWANLLKDSSWKDLKYNKNKRLIAACFFFFFLAKIRFFRKEQKFIQKHFSTCHFIKTPVILLKVLASREVPASTFIQGFYLHTVFENSL